MNILSNNYNIFNGITEVVDVPLNLNKLSQKNTSPKIPIPINFFVKILINMGEFGVEYLSKKILDSIHHSLPFTRGIIENIKIIRHKDKNYYVRFDPNELNQLNNQKKERYNDLPLKYNGEDYYLILPFHYIYPFV